MFQGLPLPILGKQFIQAIFATGPGILDTEFVILLLFQLSLSPGSCVNQPKFWPFQRGILGGRFLFLPRFLLFLMTTPVCLVRAFKLYPEARLVHKFLKASFWDCSPIACWKDRLSPKSQSRTFTILHAQIAGSTCSTLSALWPKGLGQDINDIMLFIPAMFLE